MIGGAVSWLVPAFIVGGFVLLVAFTVAVRWDFEPALRRLRGYDLLPLQAGQVIETGGRMHVSLGPNSLAEQETGVTLAGLAMLELATRATAAGDEPTLATTADATTVWVMSDIIRRQLEAQDRAEQLNRARAFLVALDSAAMAAGVTTLIPTDDVRASVLFGSFGPEVALMAEAGHRADLVQTVGSDRLEAQAAGYAMADEVLIGEEMFVARAYLGERRSALAGLLTQDALRWGIIGVIVIGVLLQTVGLLN